MSQRTSIPQISLNQRLLLVIAQVICLHFYLVLMLKRTIIHSLYSLPQPYPFQKITLLIYGILEIKLRVLPLFHNGGDQLSTNNSYHLQLLCLSWQSPIRPVKNLFNLRKEKTISNSFTYITTALSLHFKSKLCHFNWSFTCLSPIQECRFLSGMSLYSPVNIHFQIVSALDNKCSIILNI